MNDIHATMSLKNTSTNDIEAISRLSPHPAPLSNRRHDTKLLHDEEFLVPSRDATQPDWQIGVPYRLTA